MLARAQKRQQRHGETVCTEEVRIQCCLYGVEVRISAGDTEIGADPGIVDEHVQAPGIRRHVLGRCRNARRIGDVEL